MSVPSFLANSNRPPQSVRHVRAWGEGKARDGRKEREEGGPCAAERGRAGSLKAERDRTDRQKVEKEANRARRGREGMRGKGGADSADQRSA